VTTIGATAACRCVLRAQTAIRSPISYCASIVNLAVHLALDGYHRELNTRVEVIIEFLSLEHCRLQPSPCAALGVEATGYGILGSHGGVGQAGALA
jgi:hypothetical protein